MKTLNGLMMVGVMAACLGAPARGADLPAGHPQVPAAKEENPGLPAGHPKVPAGNENPGLPAGHPQVPAGNDNVLPDGHPGINASSVKGSIIIKAVQASKGGPAIGADPVVVEYFGAGGKVKGKAEGTLSDKGEITIKDIPVGLPIQPLITIRHGGVEYKTSGNVMDARRREQTVEMNLFESSDQEPAWEVRMRHVIVAATPQGLNVTEMISVFNPSDRSWTGKGGATLAITLPANATDVQSPNGLTPKDGKVIYAGAMQPGSAEFQFTYVVPAKDDAAEVSLLAPAPNGSLFVFLPEDGTTVTSAELKKMEVKPGMNLRENSRFYTAPPQKAGDRVKFVVSGLKNAKPVAAASEPGASADWKGETPAGEGSSGIPTAAKVIGGIGAAGIVVAGAAIAIFRHPKSGRTGGTAA